MSVNIVDSNTGVLSPIAGTKQNIKYKDITHTTTSPSSNYYWEATGISTTTYPYVINIQSLSVNIHVTDQIIGRAGSSDMWYIKLKNNTSDSYLPAGVDVSLRFWYIEE